jgi:hypothetical protein
MQTFVPLPNYIDSMRCLDKTRLGNQVWREGITLIRGGWKHHPARKMWQGHEYHLGLYLLAGCDVLKERTGKGYPEIRKKIRAEMAKHRNTGPPPWLGNEDFHASHRSNLLRKVGEAQRKADETKKERDVQNAKYQKEWYQQFNWTEPDNLPYVWPV